ncbi:MAG: hypothetical protein PHH37_05020 [Paludibacter sp.]|nr:hypothetical protein [Paludibacter sp.]
MKKKITILFMSLLSIVALNAQNLLSGWDGNGVTGDASKPTDVGWLNTDSASVPWNTANGSGGCRFRDAGDGFTSGTFTNESDNSVNDSRQLMLRFDNGDYSASVYAYPVTLEANATYAFTMDYVCGGSAVPPMNITAGASTTPSEEGLILSKTYETSSNTTIYRKAELTFSTGTEAGTCYITFTGGWAWFGITNLNLQKIAADLTELNSQANNLQIDGIEDGISDDLTLPTTLGTQGVTCSWASSDSSIIDPSGKVTQPEKYDTYVTLTATVSQTINDEVYTVTKTFKVKVLGVIPTPLEIADFTFENSYISYEDDILRVTDTKSGFKGTFMNGARLRTIGTSEKINVLDLGSNNGYFDMGQEIGQAIYSLSDYTIMGYFRVNENYTGLSSAGNYYWNFSNSDNVGTIKNGFMYGNLSAQAAGISAAGSPSTKTSVGSAASQGAWHHICYTQTGTTGTLYIDGVQMAQNTAMPLVYETIAKDSLPGTICNWLGRSGWTSDVYLKTTLLYDFRVMSVPVTSDDLNFETIEGLPSVQTTLDRLNVAYAEDSDYISEGLNNEYENLSLEDLSHVTGNISLPTKGSIDESVIIKWKTSNNKLITSDGTVTRPDYYDYNVTLTATLLKDGQSTTKDFTATVIANEGTAFTGDLLYKLDCASVSSINDRTITESAEKHFTATLMNDAAISRMGTTNIFYVVNLGDSIGYVDLGTKIGQAFYNLTDYTVSAYYRIEDDETTLAGNGNFLWTFSNNADAATYKNGYIIGSLYTQSQSVTPGYYDTATGNQSVSIATPGPALKGSWHHMAYVQSGTIGNIYVDGILQNSAEITNTPATTLPQDNLLGTPYNWIGRSNYVSDAYLRKTLVYDLRLYSKALSDNEILTTDLNVGNTIAELDEAYTEGIETSVKSVNSSEYKIGTALGKIKIYGLAPNDRVNIFDVTGRNIYVTNSNIVSVNAGVYIIKINNFTTKVVVK